MFIFKLKWYFSLILIPRLKKSCIAQSNSYISIRTRRILTQSSSLCKNKKATCNSGTSFQGSELVVVMQCKYLRNSSVHTFKIAPGIATALLMRSQF